MLSVNINTTAVEKRLADMQAKINHLKRVDLGQEMSEWQTDDMQRHRPFTMRFRAAGKVQTVVRPHSLYEMLRSQGVYLQAKELRHVRRAVSKHLKHPLPRTKKLRLREHRRTSMRPILRAELWVTLQDRMRRMVQEKLTWA